MLEKPIKSEGKSIKSLQEKYLILKELEKDPNVQKYLELLNEVYMNVYSYPSHNPVDGKEYTRFGANVFGKCKHKIWMYAGSYYRFINIDGEEDLIRLENECSGDVFHEFAYNEYECLDCGQKLQVEDWEEFEEKNTVLKTYLFHHNDYYRQVYYEKLYNGGNIEECHDYIINVFNNDIKLFSNSR